MASIPKTEMFPTVAPNRAVAPKEANERRKRQGKELHHEEVMCKQRRKDRHHGVAKK
jgi:hypothetical protein